MLVEHDASAGIFLFFGTLLFFNCCVYVRCKLKQEQGMVEQINKFQSKMAWEVKEIWR